MLERMMGAARLNAHTFEEVENDENATTQALLVVVIVSIAIGIGSLGVGGILGLVIGIIWGVIGWALWALITFWLGTKIFSTSATHANWGQLARVVAFAQTPGVFRALGFIPIVGPIIIFISSLWVLVAMVVAVRQALDYESTWRAIGVVVIGGIIYYIIYAVWLITLSGLVGGLVS